MSTTQKRPTEAHVLVRRVGPRMGAFHAAVLVEAGLWRTACGEDLRDGPRGAIVSWQGREAHEVIADPHGALCRRCDRVGDSVDR